MTITEVAKLMSPGRWRALVYPALVGLAAGMLAACAAEQKPVPPTVATVEAPPPEPAPPPRRPVRPIPRPAPKPTPPQDALAAPGAAEMAGVGYRGALIGLDPAAAARLFGQASEKSEKSPARVWRYKTDTCELDLFFYLDLRSGKMRTLHYSFKGDAGDLAKRQECLRAIVDRRNNRTTADAAPAAR
jgi:hypothetical protein